MIPTDLLKRLKPLYGSLIDALWLEYQAGDDSTRREIESLLQLLAYRQLGLGTGDERLLLEPPDRTTIGNGDVYVGDVIYPGITAFPFRVERNELLRHVFILGPSGTGKSTLLLGILLQLLSAKTPFMVFDFKRNYRSLLPAENAEDLTVFTVARPVNPLRFNALRAPPGMEFAGWAEALADVCGSAYLLLQGARNVLKEALQQAESEQGSTVTLRDAYLILKRELESSRSGSRRYGWLESATRTLQELSTGPFGSSMTDPNGLSLEDLLRGPVVMELEALGDDQKRFFCLLMLQSILLTRKQGTAARERLQHVLIFDESHNVFPKEQFGQLSVPSRLAREVREYGEAIIAATQQGDVADSLIANSGIKIFLRCDFPRDVELASKLLHIDAKWLPKLPMGFGIVRLPTRHYTPFLFHFNEQPFKNQHVPDTLIRARSLEKPPNEKKELDGALREEELALLRDILEYPISSITERYTRLKWSMYTGNNAKDSLIRQRLASFEPVPLPNGRIKILCLTNHGIEELTRRGHAPSVQRRGGAEHEYWRYQLRKKLEEEGYEVTEEYPLGNGAAVDLRAVKQLSVVIVEVETGKSNVDQNITKCEGVAGRVLFFFVRREDAVKYAPVLSANQLIAIGPDDLHHLVDYLQ